MKHRKHRIKKKSLKLKKNHTWKAPKGYKVVVLDRGAVSFNVPGEWIVHSMEPQFEMHDALPPNDETRLSASFWRLPQDVDFSGLPLVPMLMDAVEKSEVQVLERGEIVTMPRTDIEVIWLSRLFLDPEEKREAFSYIALARGHHVQALVTCDFWETDLPRIAPVWDEVLGSLRLGRKIADPTQGEILQ